MFGCRLLGPFQDQNYSPISVMDDNTRVVIMDQNFGIFSNEEEQIDVVDQSGYLLGPHISGGLNNVPIALYWWNEESRMCDGSAVLDSAMYFSNIMYSHLEAARTKELAEMKEKRLAVEALAKTNPNSNTNSSDKPTVMETNADIPAQRTTSTSTSNDRNRSETETDDDMSILIVPSNDPGKLIYSSRLQNSTVAKALIIRCFTFQIHSRVHRRWSIILYYFFIKIFFCFRCKFPKRRKRCNSSSNIIII